MANFVLAIDQGTTGTTVALMDASGKLRASVNCEFPQLYPKPGWVEHRPADIWASVGKGIRAILRQGVCKPIEIAAIGITNQRETALLWDRRSGEPLHNHRGRPGYGKAGFRPQQRGWAGHAGRRKVLRPPSGW